MHPCIRLSLHETVCSVSFESGGICDTKAGYTAVTDGIEDFVGFVNIAVDAVGAAEL